MTNQNLPKEETKWFRTHFENGGSVLLRTEETSNQDELFRPLIITAAPVAENVYVITADLENSVWSREFQEDPPSNTKIMTSADLASSVQILKNMHDQSDSRLIVFVDSIFKMIDQMSWGDFEDAIISLLDFAAQREGVVYIHQRKSELDIEKQTALAKNCDIISEYDEKSKNWLILDRN